MEKDFNISIYNIIEYIDILSMQGKIGNKYIIFRLLKSRY